ncbi:hypothetical protein [Helicobacter cynogastricus]|uniref:OMP868 n=1 Tax=Helicobacter cynogastricus TaxID=329937 RepID=A0A1R3UCT8_9HELI|nr:hypothetical protein [Helicobacter cynogastricus]SFZ72119.1 OMP868 [Helicobacter cynogastricus]
MSHESYRNYQLRAQRERELREQQRRAEEQKARGAALADLMRFQSTLDFVSKEGLDSYAKREIADIRAQIKNIENLSTDNPMQARTLSARLNYRIEDLPRLCAVLKEEHLAQQRRLEELERQRKIAEQQAKEKAHLQALSAAWEEALQGWSDKSARNLALDAIATLHAKIFTNPQEHNPQEIKEQMAALEAKFQGILQAQQAQEQQALEAQYKQELLEKHQANLPAHATLLSLAELQAKVQKIEQAQMKKAEDEAVRKEMVKAVYQSLQQAGFSVQAPTLDPEKDLVIVRAMRANGAQAQFRVSLDGVLNYRFDHYEGKACKADMDQVLPKLSEVYGVDLGEERVIWENPDDLDKCAFVDQRYGGRGILNVLTQHLMDPLAEFLFTHATDKQVLSGRTIQVVQAGKAFDFDLI